MRKSAILIASDDPPLRRLFTIILLTAGYRPAECSSAEAVKVTVATRPDMVLTTGGADAVADLREATQRPLLACVGEGDDEEIIQAFGSGADDCVTRPVMPDVLLARVYALLRRSPPEDLAATELVNGVIRLDLVRHEVSLAGVVTLFTPREYDLLRYLVINQGRTLSSREILCEIWGAQHATSVQYLRVYINQLRDKLNEVAPGCIYNDPGVGYRMEIL